MSNATVAEIAQDDYCQLPMHNSSSLNNGVLTRCDLCGLVIGFRRPALACHHCCRPLCSYCAHVLGIPGTVKTTSVSPSPLRVLSTVRHTYKGDATKVASNGAINPEYISGDVLPYYMESLGPSPSPQRDKRSFGKNETSSIEGKNFVVETSRPPSEQLVDQNKGENTSRYAASPSPRGGKLDDNPNDRPRKENFDGDVADAQLDRPASIKEDTFIPQVSSEEDSGVSEGDEEILIEAITSKNGCAASPAPDGEENNSSLIALATRADGVTTLTTPISEKGDTVHTVAKAKNMFMENSSDEGDIDALGKVILPRPPSQLPSLTQSPTGGSNTKDPNNFENKEETDNNNGLRPIDDVDNPFTDTARRTLRRFRDLSHKGVAVTYRSCNGRDADHGVLPVKKFVPLPKHSKANATMTSMRSNDDDSGSNFDGTFRGGNINDDFTQTFTGGVASASKKIGTDSNYGGSSEEGEDDEALESLWARKQQLQSHPHRLNDVSSANNNTFSNNSSKLSTRAVTQLFGANNNHGAPEERLSVLQYCLGGLSTAILTPNVQRIFSDALGYRHHQLSTIRSQAEERSEINEENEIPQEVDLSQEADDVPKLIAALPFNNVSTAPQSSPKTSVNNRQPSSAFGSFREQPTKSSSIVLAKFWCGECDLNATPIQSKNVVMVDNLVLTNTQTSINNRISGPPLSPASNQSATFNNQHQPSQTTLQTNVTGSINSPSPGPSSFFGGPNSGENLLNAANSNQKGLPAQNNYTSANTLGTPSTMSSPPNSGPHSLSPNSNQPTSPDIHQPSASVAATAERIKATTHCQVCNKKFGGALVSVFKGKKCQCGACGKVVCENKCCREVVRTLLSLPLHLQRTLGYNHISPTQRLEGGARHADPNSPRTSTGNSPSSHSASAAPSPTIILTEANVQRLRNGMVKLYMCNGCMLGHN